MESLSYFVQKIAIITPPFLIAITFHELAHGWVADRLGDPTARLAGRLTLNPLKHLDPFGTLAIIITQMIGWAKPVPVNPYNLRNPRKDMVLVAAAGPGMNLAIALLSGLLYRLLLAVLSQSRDLPHMETIAYYMYPLLLMIKVNVQINVALAIFNIIPIPPLDGGRILSGLLPREQAESYSRIEPYGFIILLALIFTDVISRVIGPVIFAIVAVILSI